MAIGTYQELLDAGANWLHRTDLTARMPEFVSLAEAKMNRLLKTAEMETSTTLTAAASVALPTGFVQARRLRLNDGGVYTDMQLVSLTPSLNNGQGGTPQVASIQGSNLIPRPPPAAGTSYTFALDYLAKFTPLSASAPTNWILTNHPDAYLYGMLSHSAPFLGADARLSVWAQLFLDALDDINANDAKKRFNNIKMRTDLPAGRGSYNINTDQ